MKFHGLLQSTWFWFAVAFVLCVPGILFDPIPANDVAMRYAPMVEAFGEGDWQNAFHPRVQPLFILVTGPLAALGLSGFAAAKLVSSVFFALGVFPLRKLNEMVFNKKHAYWTIAIYALCPKLIRLGGTGLRDALAVFLLIAATCALLCFLRSKSWSSSLCLGLSCAGLILVRGEAVLMCAALLIWAIAAEAWFLERKLRLPGKSLSAAAVVFLLSLPWVMYCISSTGYPVTAPKQIVVLRKLERCLPFSFKIGEGSMPEASPLTSSLEQPAATSQPETGSTDSSPASVRRKHWLPIAAIIPLGPLTKHFDIWIVDALEGLILKYWVLLLPYVIWRIRKKLWSRGETFLATIATLHVVLIIGLTLAVGGRDISSRHIVPAAPLLMGWTAGGTAAAVLWLKKWKPWVAYAILFVVIFALVRESWHRTRRRFRASRKQEIAAVQDCAQWLEERLDRSPDSSRPARSHWYNYNVDSKPVVIVCHAAMAYLADAGSLDLNELGRPVSLTEFTKLYDRFGAQYFVEPALCGSLS